MSRETKNPLVLFILVVIFLVLGSYSRAEERSKPAYTPVSQPATMGEKHLPFLTEIQRVPKPRTAEEVIRDFRAKGKHWVSEEDFLAELRGLKFKIERLEEIRDPEVRVRYCYPPEEILVEHAVFRDGKFVGFGWKKRACRNGEPIFRLKDPVTGEYRDAFSGDCGNPINDPPKPKPEPVVEAPPLPEEPMIVCSPGYTTVSPGRAPLSYGVSIYPTVGGNAGSSAVAAATGGGSAAVANSITGSSSFPIVGFHAQGSSGGHGGAFIKGGHCRKIKTGDLK